MKYTVQQKLAGRIKSGWYKMDGKELEQVIEEAFAPLVEAAEYALAGLERGSVLERNLREQVNLCMKEEEEDGMST